MSSSPSEPRNAVGDRAAPRRRTNRGSDFRSCCSPSRCERGIATPIIWFLLDWLVFAVAIASLLVVESWWVRVFASLVGGLWIARLFVIGHDACHGSYTPNKTLNKWIGRIAFLPSLTPYSLWEIGHNLAHHGFTNLEGPRLRLDALLAARVRPAVLDPPAARAHLSQRLRPGRLLHDRDVVEEAVSSRAASTSTIGASAIPGTACW